MPVYPQESIDEYFIVEIWIIYFVSTSINSIMMLNFIISVISNSYEEVIMTAKTVIANQSFEKVKEYIVWHRGKNGREYSGAHWTLFTRVALESKSDCDYAVEKSVHQVVRDMQNEHKYQLQELTSKNEDMQLKIDHLTEVCTKMADKIEKLP